MQNVVFQKGTQWSIPKKDIFTFSLREKVELPNYRKENPKMSCRDIAEVFKMGRDVFIYR